MRSPTSSDGRMLARLRIGPALQLALVLPLALTLSAGASARSARDMDQGLVQIRAKGAGQPAQYGTGFVFQMSRESALILTAAHVLSGGRSPEVAFSGRPFSCCAVPARIVFRDPRLDLALVEVRGATRVPNGVKVVPLARLRPEQLVGEAATVMGFPRSNQQPWRRPTSVATTLTKQGEDVVVRVDSPADAALDDGLSGGPVVARGRVAGVYLGIRRAGTSPTGRFVASTRVLDTLDAFARNGTIAEAPDDPATQFSLIKVAARLVDTGRELLRRGDDEVALLLLRQALAYGERVRAAEVVAGNAYDVFGEYLSKPVSSQKLGLRAAPETAVRGARSMLLGWDGEYVMAVPTATGRVALRRLRLQQVRDDGRLWDLEPSALALYDGDRKAIAVSWTRVFDCEVMNDGVARCRELQRLPEQARVDVDQGFHLVPGATGLPNALFRGHHGDLKLVDLDPDRRERPSTRFEVEPYLDIRSYDGDLSCLAIGGLAHHQVLDGGATLWAMNGYGLVNVFDVRSGRRTRIHTTFFDGCKDSDKRWETSIRAVALHEPTRRIAISQGLSEGRGRLLVGQLDDTYRVRGLEEIDTYCSHRESGCEELPPVSLDWSTDGTLLGAGTANLPGAIRVYDAAQGFSRVISDGAAHSSHASLVRFLPGTQTLISLSGGFSGREERVAFAKAWVVRDSRPRPEGIDDLSKSLAFSPDGKLLVAAGHNDSNVRLYDGDTLELLGHIPMHGLDQWERMSFSMDFGDDSGELVTGSTRGRISRWSLPANMPRGGSSSVIPATRHEIGRVDPERDYSDRPTIDALALSRSSRELFSCDGDGNVIIWNVEHETREELDRVVYRCRDIAAAADGKVVAVAAESTGVVMIRSAEAWSTVRLDLSSVGPVTTVAVSAGSLVAMGSSRGRVALFDALGTERPLAVIPAQDGEVNVVAFSPTEPTLAVGGSDAAIVLYDTTKPDEPVKVRSLVREGNTEVTTLAFDPPGERMVTGDDDGHLEVWDPRSPIGRICDLVTRNLTAAEWREHVARGATDVSYERTCSQYPSGSGAPPAAPTAF